MTNGLWAIFLGTGATGGVLSFVYTVYKDVTGRSTREKKEQGEIQLDTSTEKRIAAEAAQINSDVAIAQQTWWKEQFETMRVELTKEQKSNLQLRRWAREHQSWDETAWVLAVQSDPDYPPPPKLEDL